MINQGYVLQRFFLEVKIETPAHGWRRTDDTLFGGVDNDVLLTMLTGVNHVTYKTSRTEYVSENSDSIRHTSVALASEITL